MTNLISNPFVAVEIHALEVWEEEGGALQQISQISHTHEVDDSDKVKRLFFVRGLQRDFGVYDSLAEWAKQSPQ